MSLFRLPEDLRNKIWAISHRGHVASVLKTLVVRKSNAVFTDRHGKTFARMIISPTKLMHLSLVFKDNLRLLEVIQDGLLVERWWEAHWDCGAYRGWGQSMRDGRYHEHPDEEFDASMAEWAMGFDYSDSDGWPDGHVQGIRKRLMNGNWNHLRRLLFD